MKTFNRSEYTDEFKLEVIKDYYTNDLGVRQTAVKWGLPTKNYVGNWEKYLRKKRLIPDNWIKKPHLKTAVRINKKKAELAELAELEALRKENQMLRCSLDYMNELEKLVKKKTDTKR